MRPLTRITPKAATQAFQTYQVASPPDRTIAAACERVGCQAWRNGWDTIVDERTDLGERQAACIRSGQTGRSYREMRTAEGLTVFRFEAKQRCFTEHKTRPELYIVRVGDWRANGGLIRRHQTPEGWVEDFGEHQDRINQAIQQR